MISDDARRWYGHKTIDIQGTKSNTINFFVLISVFTGAMPKAATQFIFGLLVGLVFTFIAFAYITGTNIQRSVRIPVKSESVSHTAADQSTAIRSVLTHEDLEKIQQIIRPVQFKDEHHHHGKDLKNAFHIFFQEKNHLFRHNSIAATTIA